MSQSSWQLPEMHRGSIFNDFSVFLHCASYREDLADVDGVLPVIIYRAFGQAG